MEIVDRRGIDLNPVQRHPCPRMVRRVVVAGLVLGCGCNQVFGLEASGGGDDDVPIDGGGGWSGMAKIAVASQVDLIEEDPAITPDGSQLYFTAYVTGGFKDLWVSNRINDTEWEPPATSPLSSTATDGSPRFRDPENDGAIEIYFASDRLGGPLDIFSAARAGAEPWSTPAEVPDLSAIEENSTAAPCDTPGRFVVASRRGGASSDLYELAGTAVAAIDPANTASNETAPFLTRDCLHLYYGSNVRGTFDLYLVTRPAIDQPWGRAEMIPELSTSFDEGDPWLGDDERRILYSSNAAGQFDIYQAFR